MPPRKDGKHFETHRFRTEAGWRDVEIRHDGTNFFAHLAGRRYTHPGIQPLREELEQAQRLADLVPYKLYIELEFLEPFSVYGLGSKDKPFLGFVYHVSYLSDVIEVNGKKDRYRLKKEADGNYTDGYQQGEPWRQGTHHAVKGTLIEWTAEREATLHASQQALVAMREKLEGLFKGNMEEIGRRLDGVPEPKLLEAAQLTPAFQCRLCDKVDDTALICSVCQAQNCGGQDCWVGKHCKDCHCNETSCPNSDCRR